MNNNALLAWLTVTSSICVLQVIAQDQCTGLTDLASNANQSPLLRSCMRDTNCTSITCMIVDETTRMFVQEAELVLLPCAAPSPQVEFQLSNTTTGTVLFDAVIGSAANIPISIPTPSLDVSLGVLTAIINTTSTSIGIMMELTPPGATEGVILIPLTVVPLNMSACPGVVTTLLPTPDMTTTLTSGATTEDINTTTDGTGQLTPSFVLFSLVLSLSLIIL